MSKAFVIDAQVKGKDVLERWGTAYKRIEPLAYKVNQRMAPMVVEDAQARAPVATGKYRASIRVWWIRTWSFGYGTDAPQAARLEYGFIGMDSLKREYNQAPRPHLRPAMWYWMGPWKRAMLLAAKDAIIKKSGYE